MSGGARDDREPVIVVDDVWKAFDGKPVLRGAFLTARRGEVVVVLGRSGSGKTVLLKHLIGLLRPDRGRVWVLGRELTRLPERALDRVRLRMGMLFQEGALFDSLRVWENVAFPLREHARLGRREARARAAALLKLVGLEGVEELYPEQLSGGMRKRVALARALALEPEVLLCDEPTAGVDPAMAREIDHLLLELKERLGMTAVVVTHDVEEALRLGDRLAVLAGGRVVAEGPPERVRASAHPAVREFFASTMPRPNPKEG